MISRTVGFLTVVALLMTMMLTTAMPAMAERPDDKGQPGAEEDKITGSPGDTSPGGPNAWGAVTSQRASGPEHDLGEHSSDPVQCIDPETGEDLCEGPDTPRKGIGNVARTDSQMFGENTGDTGDHPADHACIVDDPTGRFGPQTNCLSEPGPL
jgi:hypothetical protein